MLDRLWLWGGSYSRELSSCEAISLTFLNSGPLMPKNVAISTICLGFAKSLGSEQNFSSVGPNSRQVIDFGKGSPSRQVPSSENCKQNSQTLNAPFLQTLVPNRYSLKALLSFRIFPRNIQHIRGRFAGHDS
jgi:hypothetical protein